MTPATAIDDTAHWLTADRQRTLRMLATWADHGWLRELDRAFAEFLDRHLARPSPLLLVGAALASHQLGRGHVCLDLAAALGDPRFVLSLPPQDDDAAPPDDGSTPPAPPVPPERFFAGLGVSRWHEEIAASLESASGAEGAPLVLDGDRLYLRRYWRYEREVAADIAARLRADPNGVRGEHDAAGLGLGLGLGLGRIRAALDVLFPQAPTVPAATADIPGAAVDWQKCACALALRSGFSVLTGGPGTGKTTTVIRLLALLQTLAFAGSLGARVSEQGLRILLAAPTGKAAARLNETIAGAVGRLSLDGLPQAERIRAAIPTTVVTLHRLLGSRPDTRRLRHDRGNPLVLDVLVVDEVSMIDLEMMHGLLSALPPHARLILLGDKDQLASVEAGAVLGELCRHAQRGGYSPATRGWLRDVTGQDIGEALIEEAPRALDQSIAMLRHSHRFHARSGIGRLARAVNDGDEAAVHDILAAGDADVAAIVIPGGDPAAADDALRALVLDGGIEPPRPAPGAAAADGSGAGAGAGIAPRAGYRPYLERLRDDDPGDGADDAAVDDWARRVLDDFSRFQLLCATRRGDDGVERINRRVERLLAGTGLVAARSGAAESPWYPGRPVMVTRNDYALGLMNGDVGIAIACPAKATDPPGAARRLRVAFVAGDGSGRVRWVLPSRLQAVETVYAMTVHKAQGSEFDHAALWLPSRPNPVLTRELVYTGITRARRWFTLVRPASAGAVLATAIHRCVQRASALGDLVGSDRDAR